MARRGGCAVLLGLRTVGSRLERLNRALVQRKAEKYESHAKLWDIIGEVACRSVWHLEILEQRYFQLSWAAKELSMIWPSCRTLRTTLCINGLRTAPSTIR